MSMMNVAASAGRRVLPNHWDLIAFAVIMAVLDAIARAYHGISAPLPAADEPAVSLDYWMLPYYALRTALRMFAALAASLVFTFTYATLAAKSRRAEMVLIPVLDILQSVPILGFLSFTVTFFLGLFPGNVLGAECAAIFAIFTSQAWNMAFSFYQSLRTVPRDLDEVARGFRLTGWQKFWQLEAPFAVPGLIWNTMMSMSGGWFFVVASEAITVGDTTITLPGVGSYIAAANNAGRWDAILAAVATMAHRHPALRPAAVPADHRLGGASSASSCRSSQQVERSWVLDLLQRTYWVRLGVAAGVRGAARSAGLWRFGLPNCFRPDARCADAAASRVLDVVWIFADRRRGDLGAVERRRLRRAPNLSWPDVGEVTLLTFYTLLRVVVLMALATLVLGADQRLDRPQAALGRGGSADRAIPRRFPGQPAVRRGGQPGARLPSQPRHLAERPHRLRHAMVHRVQHDRRRGGVPQRPARGGGEFPRPRLGLVAAGHPAGHHALLPDRRDHRLGRLVERLDRRRIRQVEGPDSSPRTASAPISPRRPTRATFPRSCSASP